MTVPVLHDAVTLRHFSAGNLLGVLAERHAHRDPPRWVEEVHQEIADAAGAGVTSCTTILGEAWLGDPKASEGTDLKKILRLRTKLGGDHPQHLGEASSIYWCEQLDGVFVTDDNEAHRFAGLQLGTHRVKDTVDVLREAVVNGEVSSADAAKFCEGIRALRPEPRHLRFVHPHPVTPADFE